MVMVGAVVNLPLDSRIVELSGDFRDKGSVNLKALAGGAAA
jgi:hypothetical protein